MKTVLAISFSLLMIFPLYAQEEEKKTGEEKEKATTEVKIGEKGTVQVTESQDTIRVKVGAKEVKIIEGENGTRVDVGTGEKDKTVLKKKKKKFDGHWDGFEIGMNNFLNTDFGFGPAAGDEFMDLNTSRSWNINLNFAEFNIGLIGSNLGLVTGFGLEFNDYHFDRNNNIWKDPDNNFITGERPYAPIVLDKSKLTTTYLTLPLLLEFQVPLGHKSRKLHFNAGPVGGLKLGSRTKVVYQVSGSKRKDKDRGDFNLSPLRYGLTARVGYGNTRVFVNYYLSPLFEKNKGPELYPFSIGLAFGN